MNESNDRQITERPIINPEEFLEGQGVNVKNIHLKKALLAFMSISEMEEKFGGQPAPESVFSHTRELPLIRHDGTILVGQVYGGPFCSIILEELAVYGVKHVVGYGFSGTLDNSVPPGTIMIAESGLCSDGTSKEYTEDSEVPADPEMLAFLQDVCRDNGIKPVLGKVWTTDALYREFPSKIEDWKSKGARFCNLETSPFYTVARDKGMKAVYLSVVSDSVVEKKWSGWSPDLTEASDKMWDISLEMIKSL